MKYKTKLCEIEAVEFRRDNWEEVKEFCNNKVLNMVIERHPNGKAYCNVETLEGLILVTEGDYIIKDVGDFYTCDPKVFQEKYEAVD